MRCWAEIFLYFYTRILFGAIEVPEFEETLTNG